MQKIQANQILPIGEYETIRPRFRQRIIDLKKQRRVSVGPLVSLVFENVDTLLFQIQEMMRAERLTAPSAIAQEVETYNELIPPEGALSATLFIEVTDAAQVPDTLARLTGLEERVFLDLGGEAVRAEAEPGRSTEEKTSTVHYLTFPVPASLRSRLAGDSPCRLRIDHPNYRAEAELSPDTRRELLQDLQD